MSYFTMSKLALKWAFTKPVTTRYPFEPRQELAGSRGWLVFTDENCAYCNVCAKKCPTAAIVVNRAEKTLAIDHLSCITCGCCVEVCPKDSLELIPSHGHTQVTKDHEVFQEIGKTIT